MRILALETCGATGSAAALDDDKPLIERNLTRDHSTSSRLAPLIREVVEAATWQMSDVELVVVTLGPGSFTGLRIGVTTAKTLAYATGAELIGVDSLQVIATQSPPKIRHLTAVLNAHRGQLFAASFHRAAGGWPEFVEATRLVDVERWLQGLAPGTVLSGPVLAKFGERLPDGVTCVKENLWAPRAKAVGQLGHYLYQQGQRDDPWPLVPAYFRPSAAEERLERSKQGKR